MPKTGLSVVQFLEELGHSVRTGQRRRGRSQGCVRQEGQVPLVVEDGLAEIPERKLWPEDGREVQSGIGRLPEEKVAQADLTGGSDEQARRPGLSGVQAAGQKVFIHIFLCDELLFEAPGYLAHCVGNLFPGCEQKGLKSADILISLQELTGVGECDVEHCFRVGFCGFHGLCYKLLEV